MAQTEPEVPTVETVATGLVNPCGLAIQPKTGRVFVADSGAGRIVRIVDGELADVITGFPRERFGEGPTFRVGPLGLTFLSELTLVVGDGGLADGEDLLRVFRIPKEDEPPIDASETRNGYKLEATDSLGAEGDFHGLVVSDGSLFVTCNGDDGHGWIARAEIGQSSVEPLRRFISTKTAARDGDPTIDAPAAITTLPQHSHLVVGLMGDLHTPGDSVLAFYDSGSGEAMLSLPTGLHDIIALAYGPRTGLLYAADFSWQDASAGGLYRLDAARTEEGDQKVVARKIVPLLRPTALAFAEDGTLYVTVIDGRQDGDEKSGKLLKIPPGL